MDRDALVQAEAAYVMQTYKRLPIVLDHGQGTEVWDVDGKRYLDFIAGIAVNALGHCAPQVTAAITDQMQRLVHTSNYFYTEPMIRLAKTLVEHSALDRVFFANSGAEANEAAIKLARRWGTLHKDGAFEIISADNSFHGRTLATLTATGKPAFHAQYDPLPAGFSYVPWNDFERLRAATTANTVAIILEPVQGEGGVNDAPAAYFQAVRRWCDEQRILLIFDEVQTGIGRTGSLFAYEQLGVEPDVMTLAKGLGGGLVIGAMLAKEPYCVFGFGDHATTFGGNPLACAGGLAVVEAILNEGVLANVQERSEQLRAALETLAGRHPGITEIRGMGLLLGVQLASDSAAAIAEDAMSRGLLVNAVRPDTLRLMPPLNVSAVEVDEACGMLAASFDRVLGEPVAVSSGR